MPASAPVLSWGRCWVAWAAAGIAALNLGLGILVLPESLPADRRRAFAWRRANPLGAFLAIRRLPGLGRYLALMLIFSLISTSPARCGHFTDVQVHAVSSRPSTRGIR